jgi:hypothetical protein
MAREISSVQYAPTDIQFRCSIRGITYITEGNEELVNLAVEGDGGQPAVVKGFVCPGCKASAITITQNMKHEFDVNHMPLLGL